jgi:putative transposase
MVERSHDKLSITTQCDLLGVPRSSYYYKPIPETEYNLRLMKEIDMLYLDNPSFGSRQMAASLRANGFEVNRKRISRLMRIMGIEAIYPKPRIKTTVPGHTKFPHLLADIQINSKDQVWGTDITYIPVKSGFLYLVAFLDLHSRYVLSWQLSNSLESMFCIEALEIALQKGIPEIVHSDQGVQYTSHAYIDLLNSKEIRVSMSGKGRCWDNIFVERFWRTLKYEEVYLKEYENYLDTKENISTYVDKYNKKRPHSSLGYKTPEQVYLRI